MILAASIAAPARITAAPPIPPAELFVSRYSGLYEALGADQVKTSAPLAVSLNFADASDAYVASFVLNRDIGPVKLDITPNIVGAFPPSLEAIAEFVGRFPDAKSVAIEGANIVLKIGSVHDAGNAGMVFGRDTPTGGQLIVTADPDIVRPPAVQLPPPTSPVQ